MNAIKVISCSLVAALFSGCASINGVQGPHGPRLTASGHATESGSYAEIGVQFSTASDFIALVSPSRWKAPVATGGSLSWLNPKAWRADPGRTGRILVGEVVVVGGVAMAAASSGGGGAGGGYSPGDSDPAADGGIGSPPEVPSEPPR